MSQRGIISDRANWDKGGGGPWSGTLGPPIQPPPTGYQAASTSLADVQAAINAVNPGDTVIIPAGSSAWAGQLFITKSVVIIGSGEGVTNITSNYNAPTPGSPTDEGNYLFVYKHPTPSSNPAFRLSHMTVNCASKCQFLLLKNYSNYAMNKVRIDHITESGSWPTTWLHIIGNIYGVADHVTHTGSAMIHVYGAGQSTWNNIIYTPGGINNFYFEDCTIEVAAGYYTLIAGESCGRYCIRHCAITLQKDCFPLCDAHGNYSGTGPSMMGMEIYNNTIAANGHDLCLFDLRGGVGLLFNNTVTGAGSVTAKARDEYNDYGYAESNPGVSALDGSPQYPNRTYYFANTRNAGLLSEQYIDGTIDYNALGHPPMRTAPQTDLDVFFESDLTNTYTYDGSHGVGFGLLAARPAAPTLTNTGYYATDTGILYLWY